MTESIDTKVSRLMHLADVYCGHADLDNRNALKAALRTELAVQGEPVMWSLLLTGEHHGIVGKAGDDFEGHPAHYKRVNVYTAPLPASAIQQLVNEQAEDEALWCKAHTVIESLLQAALRKLHAEIESAPQPATAAHEEPPEDRFCDENCVMTDHHPACKYALFTALKD
jgi:hypothetical protein